MSGSRQASHSGHGSWQPLRLAGCTQRLHAKHAPMFDIESEDHQCEDTVCDDIPYILCKNLKLTCKFLVFRQCGPWGTLPATLQSAGILCWSMEPWHPCWSSSKTTRSCRCCGMPPGPFPTSVEENSPSQPSSRWSISSTAIHARLEILEQSAS